MTSYDIIKEACVKANPSIMELEFGCEVEVEGIRKDNPYWEKDIVIDDRVIDERVVLGFYGKVPIKNIKILGRPIRLADVLLAIGDYSIGITCDGVFSEVTPNGFLKIGKWNLLNDDLRLQSQETQDFLASILKD